MPKAKKKLTGRQKLMADKTSSNIPKTSAQKRKWIQARRLVTKQTGATSEKQIPWGLVTHIYQSEEKARKTIKPSDIKKARVSNTIKDYVKKRRK